MVPFHLAVGFILLCPILLWHDVIYLPNEYYCYISFVTLRGTLWVAVSVYGIPLMCLLIIYIRILIFIRQQGNRRITMVVKWRQERDLVVIKRIFIPVGILIILAIPTIFLLTMQAITNIQHPLFFRITWFPVTLSMLILSILIILMTPKLKNITMNRWKRNRVIPRNTAVAGTIQMRTVPTTE
jgi:hypothetical protein